MHFGFSYIGLIYLLMLFIPNMIWSKNQPQGYEKYAANENRVLLFLERAGEVLVCCFVLIFSDFNIKRISVWSLWLLLSFIIMLLYEYYWIRYFKSAKTMKDFYSSVLGIPVAGATLPVCAFFLLGIYGNNFFLQTAVVILGIGHIGIHLNHYREIQSERKGRSKMVLIIKWTAIVVFAAVLLAVVTITGIRNYTAAANFIDRSKGIDEGIFVTLGGQEQYLLIRGRDIHNPVIIWLHGGPAGPDGCASYSFTKYLVDDYTVVCWDQRGCGRTYFRNKAADPDNQTVTFEQAQKDLDELVDYLSGRFGTDKVIIVGHSYGTLVGSKYSLEHPDKVSAYIGVGQVVNLESDIYSYEDALERAKEKGDDTAEMEAAFEMFLSDRSVVNMMNLRKFVNPYHPVPKESNTIWTAIKSPYMGVDDVKWFIKQLGSLDDYVSLNRALFEYILTVDVRDYGVEFQVPVGFISGSEDWITPVKYTEDYYNFISAPQKDFCLVENCGHNLPLDSPEEFSRVLKNLLENYLK